MATIFQSALSAISSTLGTNVTCTITRGNDTVSAICSGIDGMREQNEFGRIIGKNGIIRYDEDNDPSTPITEGDEITLTWTSDSRTESLRVVGRTQIGGIVRLMVSERFE